MITEKRYRCDFCGTESTKTGAVAHEIPPGWCMRLTAAADIHVCAECRREGR